MTSRFQSKAGGRDEHARLLSPRWSRARSGDAAVGWLAALAAVTLIVCILVGGRLWRIGIPGQWTWPYYADPAPWSGVSPAIVLALMLCVVLAVCLKTGLRTARREAVGLAAVLVLSFGITLNVGNAGPAGSMESLPRTVIPWIGGYYTDALNIRDVGDYLANYEERISSLTVDDPSGMGHLSDHPPGPVLFHYAVNRSMEALPRVARRFLPRDVRARAETHAFAEGVARRDLSEGQVAGIWAAAFLYRAAVTLSLVFVYLIGRELHSPETGLLAAGLAMTIPAVHLFGPYPDQLFPLLATGAFYAWLRALRAKRAGWAAAAGVVLCLGMFMTLAFVAVVALIGAASLLRLWAEAAGGEKPPERKAWLRIALGGLGGFLVASLLPMAFFDYDVYGVWRLCLSRHGTFAARFPRSYMAWTLFNPVEYALFAGIVVSALMVWQAVRDGCRWWSNRRNAAPSLLPWTLIAVLLALNLSGKNPGEVGRLWMFMMPLGAVSAGEVLQAVDRGRGWVAAVVTALAAVQLVVFRLSLDVLTLAP